MQKYLKEDIWVSGYIIANYPESLQEKLLGVTPDFADVPINKVNIKESGKITDACQKIGADEYATEFAKLCYARARQSGSKLNPELFAYFAFVANPKLVSTSEDLNVHSIEELLEAVPEVAKLNGIFQQHLCKN